MEVDAASDMDLEDVASPGVWGSHGDDIERFETAESLPRSPSFVPRAALEFASPVRRASSTFEFASPAGNVSSPVLERAVSAAEFESGEASYLSMEPELCFPQAGRRDSLASAASVTSLRHMRSGTNLRHSQVMAPKSQCDDAFASMLMAASPCRVSVASQARSGFGSPARLRAPLSLGSSIPDHRASSAFPSDMQHLLSPRGETQQTESFEGNNLQSPSRQAQVPEHEDLDLGADLSPGRRRWDGSLAQSPGRDSRLEQSLGGSSIGSVTSLRFLQSLRRSEVPVTPSAINDSQDFVSMLFVESPCRVRSPTSSCGSPTNTCFRRSGMSEHRGSASFLSDIQHMLSPRKLSPKKNSPKKGQGTSPGRQLPPVDEMQEVVHAAICPNISATPQLQRARESHPLLFSMMTPATPGRQDAPHFPMMTPATPEMQDTPQSARVEPRRLSMQQRCLDLQLEQCEAERDSLQNSLRQMEDELQQEQLQRVAAEEMLQESQRESRQQQQQFCENQRLLALRQEQRLAEGQRILQQELMQEKQELLDGRKDLEAEWLRFDMERDLMEEDRRNFLLHHVHEADAELMRRERDLGGIRDGVNQLGAQLQEERKQLATEQAELVSTSGALDEFERQLTEREVRVTARERQHATTVDRASQTPVFRSRPARRTLCCRLCSWISKMMLIKVLLLMSLYLSQGCPQIMSYFEAQEGNIFVPPSWLPLWDLPQDAGGNAGAWSGSGITSVFRHHGLTQLCAPYAQQSECPKCLVQASQKDQNTSGLDLSDVCASYDPMAMLPACRARGAKTTLTPVEEEPKEGAYAGPVALCASAAAVASFFAGPF